MGRRNKKRVSRLRAESLLIVGSPTYAEVLTCVRALEPRQVAFDFRRGTHAVGQFDSSDDFQPEPLVFNPDQGVAEITAIFHDWFEKRPQGHSAAIVLMADTCRSEAIAAFHVIAQRHVAQKQSAMLYYFNDEPTRLLSSPLDEEVFYAPTEMSVRDLLFQSYGTLVTSSSQLPPRRISMICKRLVAHAGCCLFAVRNLVETLTRDDGPNQDNGKKRKPIWITPRQSAHPEKLAGDLCQERMFTRCFPGQYDSWGANFRNDADVLHSLRQGRWLEIGVAAILADLLDVNEVRVNVKIETNSHDLNRLLNSSGQYEIDVVAASERGLTIVECKSGVWLQSDLDRIACLGQYLNATPALVIADGRPSDGMVRSAKDAGVALFTGTDFYHRAGSLLG